MSANAEIPQSVDTNDPDRQADQKEHQVEEIREHLGGLLTELDRRRHAVAPVRLARGYPVASILGAIALLGLGAGVVVWKRRQARRQNSWPQRMGRLKLALKRAVNAPEQVAKPAPDLSRKVMTAIAVAAAGAITKRLVVRALARTSKA